jgi:hypothetical protein
LAGLPAHKKVEEISEKYNKNKLATLPKRGISQGISRGISQGISQFHS